MNDIEAEANAFAMELLMPTEFLLRDLKQMGGIDLADDIQITKLAKKYRVAVSLMAIRIGQISARLSRTPPPCLASPSERPIKS
jgi:Zn-dependent peptidase ImmA (M78 family)